MAGSSIFGVRNKAIYPLILGFLIFLFAAADVGMARSKNIKSYLEQASVGNTILNIFYKERNFTPLWTGRGDRKRRNALIATLENAPTHGLPASRYRPDELMARLKAARSGADQAQIEVALSEVFLRYATDVNSGFLRPADIDGDIKRRGPFIDQRLFLKQIVDSDPVSAMAALAPEIPQYTALMKEKLELEKVIFAGGWGPQVPSSRLDSGSSGPLVVILRDRLIKMGYLKRMSGKHYDGAIEFAVRAFQNDHGLTPDGIAASVTLSEVNISAKIRLRAVLVALERLRWMNYNLGARHIWVNLPDFTAQVIDNGKLTFETRAVIGANVDGQRSPEFSENMRYLAVNPSWNVPSSITALEYFPQLQQNSDAFNFFELVSADGEVVSRDQVDFLTYTPETFPFRLRQPPSDDNALGRVKFMFPNINNIYMHDTPQKSLFSKEIRAFSHGCIRLAQPLEFAHVLLARQSDNPYALFQKALSQAPNEYIISLANEVPVHLVYFTAFPNSEGKIQYRRDVYGRDPIFLDALRKKGLKVIGLDG
ncbi:MAG: L,D-transpeptidase family protein [Paracoccaceae bacterium]|jgi:murein L,D-transpeptidase YcbB/YkuD